MLSACIYMYMNMYMHMYNIYTPSALGEHDPVGQILETWSIPLAYPFAFCACACACVCAQCVIMKHVHYTFNNSNTVHSSVHVLYCTCTCQWTPIQCWHLGSRWHWSPQSKSHQTQAAVRRTWEGEGGGRRAEDRGRSDTYRCSRQKE